MTGERVTSARRTLQTPRAAAVAGIAFAVLAGASIVLIRLSIPSDPLDSGAWLVSDSRGTVALALNLAPFAGIAFLWFMGVVRDHFGSVEDRLFATVFLGSGLLFLAMFFTGAAMAGGLLAMAAALPEVGPQSEVYAFGRLTMYATMNTYAFRMAGVFMLSLGTIWVRTGLMPRWLVVVTYVLALTLLLSITINLWVTLIFPAWVLLISVYVLAHNLRRAPATDVRGVA